MINKIKNMIKRCWVSGDTADKGQIANIQITYGAGEQTRSAYAEMIYPYGMQANPPKETVGFLSSVMADESNLAVIPYCRDKRFKNLKTGETIFGSPIIGSYIKFLIDGSIEIHAKNGIILITDNGDIGITSPNNLNTQATTTTMLGQVNMGNSGAKIARLGDQVTIGTSTGTITSAGNNTSI
jgi:hypothetical protein